jgi:N-acetylneuraminic acid mutarotase
MADCTIEIQTCEHKDEISVFCGAPHNIALCTDCFFEKQDVYGKNQGKTLKKACLEQISQLEEVYKIIDASVKSC